MVAGKSTIFLCLGVGAVFAEKDSRYYAPGSENPNINDPYYWKNSLNIMQDLDQFESLYVEYSGCVWSRYGFGDGCDDIGRANQDDDEQSNEAYWYLGRTMCFRANAAYSLYGVLKGDEDLGCHKKRYIKSFFSVWGPESFASPLGLDTSSVSSQCQTWDERYMRLLAEDDRYNFQDDDSWKTTNEYPRFVNEKMTYTTGCSASGQFVTESFQGAACHTNSIVETVDFLEDFNEEIESLGCTMIYSASSDVTYGEQDNDCRDDDGSKNCFNDPLGIIMDSQACLLDQYPNVCPDPHGKLKKYTRDLNAATSGMQPFDRNIANAKGAVSYVLSALGVVMLALAMFVRTKKVSTTGEDDSPMYSDLAANSSNGSALARVASEVSVRATKVFKDVTEIEPDVQSSSSEQDGYYDTASYAPPKQSTIQMVPPKTASPATVHTKWMNPKKSTSRKTANIVSAPVVHPVIHPDVPDSEPPAKKRTWLSRRKSKG